MPSKDDIDDRKRTNRLLIGYLVVYVAFIEAATITVGMARSPLSLLLLAFIIGTAAILLVVLARVIGRADWRRFVRAIRQQGRSAGFDLPSTICSVVAILVMATVGSLARGNLPALLLGGLVAPMPLVVLTAARRRWS